METNKIYLGDSYELLKEIPDKSVDCVYVDIPYDFEGNGGGGAFGSKKRNYHKEYETVSLNTNENTLYKRKAKNSYENEKIAFGIDYVILDELVRIMKSINIFIWCSNKQIFPIMKYFIENYEPFSTILTWNKLNPIPTGNNTWLSDIEYCLYFRDSNTKLNDGYELKSKWFTSSINKNDKDLYDHPTIKPLELVKRHLAHATQPNDIILDCFMGSGTTCVAAKELGRRYIGIEIDKNYFKIAKDRLNGITTNGQTSIFTDFDNVEEDYGANEYV